MLKFLWTVICAGFIYLSVFVFGSNLLSQLNTWYLAKSWQATNATILDVKLIETKRKSTDSEGRETTKTDYSLDLKYQYSVMGKEWIGSKLSVMNLGRSAASGNYARQKYSELNRAKQTNSPVTVWFNSERPSQSVLDRDLRVMSVLGQIFAILFMGSIGIVGVYFFVRYTLLGRTQPESSSQVLLIFKFVLIGICGGATLTAIAAVVSGDLKGVAALIFPGFIVPVWIEASKHFKQEKREKEKLAESGYKNGDKSTERIKARPHGFATHIYLSVFIFLILAPVLYSEFISNSMFTWVSYLIAAITLLPLYMLSKALLKAIAYAKFGKLWLVTEERKITSGKRIQARIEGEPLERPSQIKLELMSDIQVKPSLNETISYRMLNEELHVVYVDTTHPNCLKFEFEIPNELAAQARETDSKLDVWLRLTLHRGKFTQIGYVFDDLLE